MKIGGDGMQDCNSCDRFQKCIEDGYLEDISIEELEV